MTHIFFLIKHRIAGAVEFLRTGRVESFDDALRVDQVMLEGGFADRAEAYEYVTDELNRLWDDAYPSERSIWEPMPFHELSHLDFKFTDPARPGRFTAFYEAEGDNL